jgi:TonB family protein
VAMQSMAAEPRAKDEQDALMLQPAADAAYGVDLRGHRITDDVREMNAQFAREGTSAAGGSLIPDPKNLSQDQRARAKTLFEYWALYPALRVNRDVWSDFLQRNQLPADTAHSPQVQAAEAALNAKFSSDHVSPQWSELGRKLLSEYVDERSTLVRNSAVNAPAQNRQTACPASASKLSPTSRPKLDRAPRSLAEFYPEESRRLGEEGMVLLMLHITASGCATSASVKGSSGFASLDSTVLKFYETLSFLPAQNNGAAVDADVTMPVAFKLDAIATR